MIINQDSGYLMIDIANAFVEAGYEVSLIAGRVVERSTPLNISITVDKIIRYRRSNYFLRLVTWIIAAVQIVFFVWLKYRGRKLLIVTNPPIAPLIPLVCRNPYSLLIYDLYVEKPEELPLLNARSIIVKVWKAVHIKVFSKADFLFTLTEGMRLNIEKFSKGKKCEVIPLWTDNDFLKPIPPQENWFINKHHLQGKFIVLYSGNIGISSGVEYLVEVASVIKSERIVFVIIGDGTRKQSIIRRIEKLRLENCLVMPLQSVDVFPYSLASADMAVVTLPPGSSGKAIPSKLFNYMSVGVPILCLANSASELGIIIENAKNGRCFDPECKELIADYILWASSNPEAIIEMRGNSLRISKDYTKTNANQFITMIT